MTFFLNNLNFDIVLEHIYKPPEDECNFKSIKIFSFLDNKIKNVLDIYKPDISTIEGLMMLYESCKLIIQDINAGNNLYLFNNSMMLLLDTSLDSSVDLDIRSKSKEIYTKLECIKTNKILETNLEILSRLNKG